MNQSKPDYEIPKEYQVWKIFKHNPLNPSTFILGKKPNKNEYAIFHFDGIGSTPIMIETFYELLEDRGEA